MPTKDIYHDTVKRALIKDGWTITHDPLILVFGRTNVYVDLGAEQLLAAEKEERKIAVEIKSFRGHSSTEDLEKALGQYILYEDLLMTKDPERTLYLAISKDTYRLTFSEPDVSSLITRQEIKLIIFDSIKEVILQWM